MVKPFSSCYNNHPITFQLLVPNDKLKLKSFFNLNSLKQDFSTKYKPNCPLEWFEWWVGMVTEGVNGPINYSLEDIQVPKKGTATTFKPQCTTFMKNLIKNLLLYVSLQMYLAIDTHIIFKNFLEKKNFKRNEKFLSIIIK